MEGIASALGGQAAGDVRRRRDLCEHLCVVCGAEEAAVALDRFAELPQIVAMIEREDRRALGVTVEGVPVELLVAPPARFGTELLRATGATAYVSALEPLPERPDEAAVYAALGIPWCPPELRERPFRGEPPPLVGLAAIRGDLHCHSTWSDGRASIEEMGRAARERGYEYLAICDHTPAVGAVQGLDPDAVRRQGEEIAAANEVLAPFVVLRGIECDILADGRLDLPDDVLSELDWVQASVHGGQRMPAREMTDRVCHALRNPHVSCLSHPTGRLLTRRPENAVDLERVYQVAVEQGVALEVNGLAPRLDLSGEHVRDALQAGARVANAAASPSQKRRRERRTYQLLRSSTKPASASRRAGCRSPPSPRSTSPTMRCARDNAQRSRSVRSARAGAPAPGDQPLPGRRGTGRTRSCSVGQQHLGGDLLEHLVPHAPGRPGRTGAEHEPPHRVGAVAVHERDRLEDVAEVLAHLAAVLGQDVARGRARCGTTTASKTRVPTAISE